MTQISTPILFLYTPWEASPLDRNTHFSKHVAARFQHGAEWQDLLLTPWVSWQRPPALRDKEFHGISLWTHGYIRMFLLTLSGGNWGSMTLSSGAFCYAVASHLPSLSHALFISFLSVLTCLSAVSFPSLLGWNKFLQCLPHPGTAALDSKFSAKTGELRFPDSCRKTKPPITFMSWDSGEQPTPVSF